MPLPEGYTQEEWDYDNAMSDRVRAFNNKPPINRNYSTIFHKADDKKQILEECGYESEDEKPSYALRTNNLFGYGK